MPVPRTTHIVNPGQQIVIKHDVQNTTYDGQMKGGPAADDNAQHAMIIVEDGVTLTNVRVTQSQGVGCAILGKNVKSTDCEFDHNAGPGRTGKTKGNGTPGSGYHEQDAHVHHNNKILATTNAGNKFTRSTDCLFERTTYDNERGPCQWFDINNERIVMTDVQFRVGTPDEKKRPPVLFRTELTLPGGITLIRPQFFDTPYPALSIDESSNITITDPAFGACQYAAELRNMLRRDDPTGKWKNGQPVDPAKFTWHISHVTINGVIQTTRKTGPVVRSDASNASITLHGNALHFGAPLVIRIPA